MCSRARRPAAAGLDRLDAGRAHPRAWLYRNLSAIHGAQPRLVGTGNLPKFADNLYHDAEEDFWFIPTAEVPVTNLYRDEILEESQLPIYHVAYTPCFRREKMSAGRDVRGIKRGHQFDKVEMVKFVEPEAWGDELSKIIADAEDICRRLGIPYRLMSDVHRRFELRGRHQV